MTAFVCSGRSRLAEIDLDHLAARGIAGRRG